MAPCELARLYDAHAQALFAYLLHFTRDEADTKDVLQELFCRLAAGSPSFAAVSDARGYLLRAAHNLAVDAIRRRESRSRAHLAHAETHAATVGPQMPEVDPDAGFVGAAIEAAVSRLPAEQRVVVVMKLVSGLTFERVAEVLEISPNTAASRYRYALNKLRELLRPLYEETQTKRSDATGAAPHGPV